MVRHSNHWWSSSRITLSLLWCYIVGSGKSLWLAAMLTSWFLILYSIDKHAFFLLSSYGVHFSCSSISVTDVQSTAASQLMITMAVPQISSVSAYITQFKMPNTHQISLPGVSDTHVKFYFYLFLREKQVEVEYLFLREKRNTADFHCHL